MNCASKNCIYRYQKPPWPSTNIISSPCPYCKTVFYCSERCRLQDWESTHKNSCTSINAMNMSISLNSSTASENSFSRRATAKKKCLLDYEEALIKNKSTSELGKGSYGSVKLVKDKEDGGFYAMKIISKKVIFEYSSVENLKREIKIQKKMDHPHIIKLLHYFEDKENVYLILQYAENGSLFRYLKKKARFKEDEAFVYFFQTCLGIDYLHKNGIIHRDLKPENLLLDKHGNIKLCDFGWSADSQSNKRTTFCGTIDYMAPEMLLNQPHDQRLDIWCLGVLLYELVHGVPPFKGQSENEKCRNIMKSSLDIEAFAPDLSPNIKNLIQGILKKNPKERLSMSEIFSHDWMKNHEKVYNIRIEKYIWKKEHQPSVPKVHRSVSPKSVDVLAVKTEASGYRDEYNETDVRLRTEDYNYGNNNYSLETSKQNNQYLSNSLDGGNSSSRTGVFSFGNKENNFKDALPYDMKKKNDVFGESYERLRARQMELEKFLKEEEEQNNKFNKLSNRISKKSMKSVQIEDKYPRDQLSYTHYKELSIMDRILIACGCISREKAANK